jgi:hypothetical protein
MSKEDDRLEEKLNALEEAQPENVMGGSSNSSGLKPLVSLAASIRDLPHPELDRQTVQSEKRRLVSAAREKNRASQNTQATKSSGFTGLWLFVPAVAGVALIMLMVFVLSAGVGFYFSGPSGAQAATLTNATGVLEVSATGFAGDWRLVSDGDEVGSGQRLRTGDESWVTLEFFDGTKTTLAPNTDIVLDKIDGNWGNELQVELIQNQGETNHNVIPLQGDQASYQVFTPSGEASVKGTTFNVMVEDTGVSLFTVETGEVLVSNDGYETNLAAGQSVVTELGVAMDAPSYQFSLQGQLGPKSGNTRSVAGVQFTVRGWTSFVGNPQDGDFVEVEGQINKKGEWVADRVTKLDDPVPSVGTFTGIVTSAGLDGLSIDGHPFTVFDTLPKVAVGDLVRVTFTIDGEVWTITTLEILDGAGLPDQDGDPDGDGALYFSSEKFEITDCEPVMGSTREFTTSLVYSPKGTNLSSLDVLLTMSDNRDELVEGFIESITISRGGTVLDLAQPLTLAEGGETVELVVTVTLGTGFDRLPPESKLEIKVVATEVVSGSTVSEPLSATFKVEWDCDEEVLYFSLEKFEITDCEPVVGSTREFTTSLVYSPKGTNLSSLDVLLTTSDNRNELGEGLIESITISRGGTVLDLSQPLTLAPGGETVELVVTVTLGTGFDSLPLGNKLEIKIVATEVVSDTQTGEPLRATFKVQWDCDGEEAPTEKGGHYCTTREDQHPKALKLVEKYVGKLDLGADPYGLIMDWFCIYRYGFGEIDLMLGLSDKYEIPVVEVFDLRQSGLGWGQIKRELAIPTQVGELTIEETKKEPPGKQKSEDAKDKEKPNKKNKNDD